MTMFKDMFRRGFWDDADGLSLMDFIAIWVMLAWGTVMFLVVGIALFLMRKGQVMDPFWLEFLKIFGDVPLAVIIGLFGKGAFGEFSNSVVAFKQSKELTCKEGGETSVDKSKSNYI